MNADAKQLVAQIAAESDTSVDVSVDADAEFSRPNKSVTVATRISPEHLAAIEELAGQLEVPIAALLRGWILAGLNARRDETVQSAIERLSADLQRLRELVA